jgi:hypothetical protein
MELLWRIRITQKYSGCHWSCRKRCAPTHFGTIGFLRRNPFPHQSCVLTPVRFLSRLPYIIFCRMWPYDLMPSWHSVIRQAAYHNDDLVMANTRSGSLADGLQFYLEGPAATFIESIAHAVLSITGTTSQTVSSKSLPYIFLYICSVNHICIPLCVRTIVTRILPAHKTAGRSFVIVSASPRCPVSHHSCFTYFITFN